MRAQSVKEISREMGISYETVKDSLKSLYIKAEVHSARQLMVKVLRAEASGTAARPPGAVPPERSGSGFFRPGVGPAERLGDRAGEHSGLGAPGTELPRADPLSPLRQLARMCCPDSAFWMVTLVGQGPRVCLQGDATGFAVISDLGWRLLLNGKTWTGRSEQLFASGPTAPCSRCVLAPARRSETRAALVLARALEAGEFSAKEVETLELIAQLATARPEARPAGRFGPQGVGPAARAATA